MHAHISSTFKQLLLYSHASVLSNHTCSAARRATNTAEVAIALCLPRIAPESTWNRLAVAQAGGGDAGMGVGVGGAAST